MEKNKSSFFVSVVVPLEDFETTYLNIFENIQSELDSLFWDYEILVCASRKIYPTIAGPLKLLLNRVPSIRYLQTAEELSYETLAACGAENSIGDFVVILDLKRDPLELINEGVKQCAEGADIVIGRSQVATTFLYRIGRPMARYLLKLSEYSLPRGATRFRTLSRRAVNSIFSSGFSSQSFLMKVQNCGYPSKVLDYRSLRKGKKEFPEAFHKLLRLMVFNSLRPLRFVSLIGLFGSVLACFFALYSLIVQFVRADVVEGWTSIFLLISICALLQFTMLTFISEYLGRMLRELNRDKDYSLIYEKNSYVMVNRDRINVLQDSSEELNNKVQTGRKD